ncbi:hypothetical protein GCM10010260_19210 [Streptomyces filipinensis]|uniref:Purine permease n=1 Tax=Streptomyces filipinensis TaxID=66887 RepID=A0A918I882_9ACTN|nr:hypothetical protein GCM10010260_19210 [Streptomyces filipinensis]
MAQPARGPVEAPCPTPTVHTQDAVTSVHPALVAVALGAGILPLAAPTFYAGFPARAQTVLGSGISAGALVAVLLNLFFHHLGTRSRQPAPALKSS